MDSFEVGSFHTPPTRLLSGPLFLMGVVWEPCGRLLTYKLCTCKGLRMGLLLVALEPSQMSLPGHRECQFLRISVLFLGPYKDPNP